MNDKRRRAWGLLVRKYMSGIVGAALLGAVVLATVILPLFKEIDPYTQNYARILDAPSKEHWFGTDEFGRDLFSRVALGGRISLLIAISAVGMGSVIGTPIGLYAGYYGGRVDAVLMRLMDVLLAFPAILLAVLIVAVLGSGMANSAVAIGLSLVPVFARQARASASRLVGVDYVAAARSLGASDTRILLTHIWPNIATPLIIQATYSLGIAVLMSGALGFIGLGLQPPVPEWGALLASGRQFMYEAPLVVVFPGLALTLAIVGGNLVGDALRVRYEPRLQQL